MQYTWRKHEKPLGIDEENQELVHHATNHPQYSKKISDIEDTTLAWDHEDAQDTAMSNSTTSRAQGNTTFTRRRGKQKPTTELKIRRKPSSDCMKIAVCRAGLSVPKQYEQ